MQSRIHKNNRKGFTLVEVIVVAVIVAVLALVGIQLYQGYVTESRRNTAENLAASAASFLQSAVNIYNPDTIPDLFPTNPLPQNQTWVLDFPSGEDPAQFTCPANCTVEYDNPSEGLVTATVGVVESIGRYPYKLVAAP